jgi:penicillin amidase
MYFLKRVLFSIVIFLFLAFFSIWLFLHHQSPEYEGIVNHVDVKENVEVFFDAYGIPHIYAENKEDAYMVLGYVHAQDRLFQMDLMRRVGSGRLSEVFGKDLIEADKFYRTLGINRKSKEDALKIKERIKGSPMEAIINAYLKGVNRFIEEGVWPVEYRILGVAPEEFVMENMLEMAGYMAFSFGLTLRTEPAVNHVLRNYSDSTYLKGIDLYVDPSHTIIPNYRKEEEVMADLAIKMEELTTGLPVPILEGSNSWALAPSLSKSGKVLFANDTHIKFSQPAVWYESHIEYPGSSFYGNYLPGIPFALIGHNKELAWGLTMFCNDDADLYYETIDSTNNTYLFDGKWKDMIVFNEEIKIKGADPLNYQIRETQNGPIISEFLKKAEDKGVSFWWTYSKFENSLMDVFYGLNTAKSMEDVEKAASMIVAPGLNVNYGDAKGNIAWWASAKLVKRPEGMESLQFHDGTDPDHQLTEYWDFSDNPQAVNPPWGFVYSSNNQSGMMPDSTWYPGYYAPENRAKRVNQLILSKEKWSLEDMKSINLDVTSVVERDVNLSLCSMIDESQLNEKEIKALSWLKEWSGSHAVNDPRPVLYYRWLQFLIIEVYKDELGEKYFESFSTTHRLKRSYPIVFTDARSPWWDNVATKEKESASAICTKTFIEAFFRAKNDWGSNYEKWKWGKAHQLFFEHPLGKVDALAPFFNVGPFDAPGGNETINNAPIDFINDQKTKFTQFGPQMRILIDFDDVEHSLSINPTGQSGNFMSPHYDDQALMFVSGKFRKQLMDKEIINKGTRMVFINKNK